MRSERLQLDYSRQSNKKTLGQPSCALVTLSKIYVVAEFYTCFKSSTLFNFIN